MNLNQKIIWEDEDVNKAVEHLINLISKEAKEEVWLKYQICFKKCKNGEIIVRNPETKEI
jgi:hypothetical protein